TTKFSPMQGAHQKRSRSVSGSASFSLLYFLINNRNLILKAATSLPCLFTYKK
ncbi:hypothetical protein HMPREF1346_02300, partial [Enterococcus faecium 503]